MTLLLRVTTRATPLWSLSAITAPSNVGNICFILKSRIKFVSKSNTEILRSCRKGEVPSDHQAYPWSQHELPLCLQAFVCFGPAA